MKKKITCGNKQFDLLEEMGASAIKANFLERDREKKSVTDFKRSFTDLNTINISDCSSKILFEFRHSVRENYTCMLFT